MDRAFERSHSLVVKRFYKELLGVVLTEQEWEDFTKEYYNAYLWSDKVYDSATLFDWELKAIKATFPAPPANILVLAAGKGREMRALQNLGYHVFGIDFDRDALDCARASCAGEKLLGTSCASFRDLANTQLPLPATHFDGVIIGWGGLSYVPSERIAISLCDQLLSYFPNVPILVSWITYDSRFFLMRLYRRIRSSIPLFSPRFQATFHRHIGPMRLISWNDMFGFIEKRGAKIEYQGSRDDYAHLIIRSKKEL